jgi:hypothetical protein
VSESVNDSVTINPGDVAARLVDRAEYLAARGDFTSAGLMILARKTIALVLAQQAPPGAVEPEAKEPQPCPSQ